MKVIRFHLSCLFYVLILLGCAAERQTEKYDYENVNPLTLTINNHPHGFGKESCFNCHLPQNIHQVNRLNDPSFSLAPVYVREKGITSCSGCHGTNGVNP